MCRCVFLPAQFDKRRREWLGSGYTDNASVYTGLSTKCVFPYTRCMIANAQLMILVVSVCLILLVDFMTPK